MFSLGIFDSGIGGLSLVEACQKAMPGARLLYVADTAHQPYGQKTSGQVVEYSQRICEFLQAQGADVILVACSTASAVAVPVLQRSSKIPVSGLLNDGWVKEALEKTRNGRIGILATKLTTKSGLFAKALEQKALPGVQIFGQAAPELIDLISEGRVEEGVLIPEIQHALGPLLERDMDTLVIGCTHFNFILPQLKRVAGEEVQIVNPRDAAVRIVAKSFPPLTPPYKGGEKGVYYVTGDIKSFLALVGKLWRADAQFRPLELFEVASSAIASSQ